MQVHLDNIYGAVLMTTTTDANGNYQFQVGPSVLSQISSSSSSGAQIQVVIPSGEVATVENAVGPGTADSNINSSGYSNIFALLGGGNQQDNAGLISPSPSPAPPPPTSPPGGDVYTWSPLNPQADINAYNPQNWLLNGVREQAGGTIPGNQASDEVLFDASVTNGNANINWVLPAGTPQQNQKFTFSTMTLGPIKGAANTAYTGMQSITAGYTLELTGVDGSTSLATNVTKSNLNLEFGVNSVFLIDNNATITNMSLGGDRSGNFGINGGTTYIAQNPGGYKEQIAVGFFVNPDGTLVDMGYNPLLFSNNGAYISIEGSMQVYYGSNTAAGKALIDSNGWSNDYIDVNGGTLTYKGIEGHTDTFTVPVLVDNCGTFVVTSIIGFSGGTLIVKDDNYICPNGSIESVYLDNTDPEVQLSGQSLLECDDGYYQANGILENTDASNCVLQVGSKGQGTATIAGGTLAVNSFAGVFPTFTVAAAQLSLSGELDVCINGPAGGQNNSTLLYVTGATNIQNADLGVDVIGALNQGQTWTVIEDLAPGNSNIQGDFINKPYFVTPVPPPGTNLNGAANKTKYVLSY